MDGGGGDGTFTHLVELDPLLRLLGAGVGHPEGPELGPEEVGGVSLHGGHVEAENLGGEFGTVEQIVWKRDRETCLSKKKHLCWCLGLQITIIFVVE